MKQFLQSKQRLSLELVGNVFVLGDHMIQRIWQHADVATSGFSLERHFAEPRPCSSPANLPI